MKKLVYFCLMFFFPLFLFAETKWEKCKKTTLNYQKNIPGWCSAEKVEKLMDLIRETKPKICVEVGVFGGSSVYPIAAALRYTGSGMIYAIDPWAAQDCQVGFAEENENYKWWTNLDWEKVYKDFVQMMEQTKMMPYCNVMRMNSHKAVVHFADASIDILHIDGNHSEEASMADVRMFLPKVKRGGYLWFDDANWSETQKTVQYLKDNLILLPERCVGNACLLFRKP